jgi:virulence factor
VLKIGIIGLGDIAQKAYLPIISKKKIQCHLFSRSDTTLREVAENYRFNNTHSSLDSLISSGVQAAFVHTATSSHFEIVEKLLNNNIHVYVDKPLTSDFHTSKKLIALAEKKGLILLVGFNRRYAPAYQQLKTLSDTNMVVMQKNRKSLPGDIRTFVFDDFIHVVDTLLYFFPHQIEGIDISGRKKNNMLYHVVLQLFSLGGATAIGIMNRDSGTTEETLEVFSSEAKMVAHNLNEVFIHKNKQIIKTVTDDWTSTLHKRGFEQIVDDFLNAVEWGKSPQISISDHLHTHKICEQIVEKLQVI